MPLNDAQKALSNSLFGAYNTPDDNDDVTPDAKKDNIPLENHDDFNEAEQELSNSLFGAYNTPDKEGEKPKKRVSKWDSHHDSNFGRNIGKVGRHAPPGVADLADLPFIVNNVGAGILGEDKDNYGFSPKRMGNREIADPRTGDVFIPHELEHKSFGLGDKWKNYFDKITDSKYVPTDPQEQKLGEYIEILAGIGIPGGARKVVTSLLSAAPSLTEGINAVGAYIKKIAPNALKTTGEALATPVKKVGHYLGAPGTPAETASALASKYTSDSLNENLDMDSPFNRTLSAVAAVGTDPLLRLGGTAAKGALFKGVVDPKKVELSKKYGVDPELTQILHPNTYVSDQLKMLAQNQTENPFSGIYTRKKRAKNVETIADKAGILGITERDYEPAAQLIHEAFAKHGKERAAESERLRNKVFGDLDEKALDGAYIIPKSSELTPEALAKRIKDYVAYEKSKGRYDSELFNTPSAQLYKKLDKFAHSDDKNVKTFKFYEGGEELGKKSSSEPIEITTDKRNIRGDRLVPNHLLARISKLSEVAGLPPQIKDLIAHIKRNKGTITIENYDHYRQFLNQIKRSNGERAYKDKDVAGFRQDVKKDMEEKLATFSGDRKKAFEKYLKFHSDWYDENPKKHVQKKIGDQKDGSEHDTFTTFVRDFLSHNKLQQSYLSHLKPEEAKKVYKELSTHLSFDPTNKETNLFKWAREFNDLSAQQKSSYNKIHHKAHGDKSFDLNDISELVLNARATFPYGNTSQTARHTLLNRLLYGEEKTPITTQAPKKPILHWNPAVVAYNITKKIVPFALSNVVSYKYLYDPKFIDWVGRSDKLKGVTPTLHWLNEASKYKFLSKPTVKMIQGTFLEAIKKQKEAEEEEKKKSKVTRR